MLTAGRCRWPLGPGRWAVRGRVERFVEPAVLLLLSEAPRHGYELKEEIARFVGDDSADVGNLYRILRQLELEGILRSTWDRGAGPAKRTYHLTPAGRRLLDQWAVALRRVDERITAFLARYPGDARV